jgi:HD-GYP domain-containing protein (c-di-GMP phosphodiesterase class II)
MRPTSPIEFVARDGDQSRKRTRNENQPSLLANISVADSSPITKAWDLAKDRSDPYLFNHSVRSWLFAVQIAQRMEQIFDEEVVAIGCLLHDIGLTKGFDGPNRFRGSQCRPFIRTGTGF